MTFPVPAELEKGSPPTATRRGFTRAYWLYTAAGGCFAAGLMSFELISFHLATRNLVGSFWIPTFLALATLGGIAASLVLGRLFDRYGTRVVVAGVLVAAAFPPLVFLGGAWAALAGLMLWGVGYATQDTLLKALIATVLPEGRRSFAFGLFYVGYGSGWLVGSVTVGMLYARSSVAVVVFAMTAMLLSVPLFLLGARAARP